MDEVEKLAKQARAAARAGPDWQLQRHPNGQRKWADDGTMLNDKGTRSIFDDVDE